MDSPQIQRGEFTAMKNEPTKKKFVTEAVLKKEISVVNNKIDNVALELLKTQRDVELIKETMATKKDTDLILNRIDHLLKKVILFEQEEGVKSIHLTEVKHTVEDHEKRLIVLETTRPGQRD